MLLGSNMSELLGYTITSSRIIVAWLWGFALNPSQETIQLLLKVIRLSLNSLNATCMALNSLAPIMENDWYGIVPSPYLIIFK